MARSKHRKSAAYVKHNKVSIIGCALSTVGLLIWGETQCFPVVAMAGLERPGCPGAQRGEEGRTRLSWGAEGPGGKDRDVLGCSGRGRRSLGAPCLEC